MRIIGLRRSLLVGVLTLGMTGFVADLGPVTAAYANLTNHSLDGFEVDGNFAYPTAGVTPSGTMDWENVSGGATRLTPDDPAAPASDSIFTGGSKEQSPDGWVFSSGSAPGKDDVTRAYFAKDVSSPSKAYLFLGYERLDISGQGDAHANFEINQSSATVTNSKGTAIPKRTAGDLLVVYDYDGGSSATSITVEVRQWSGSALGGSWGPNIAGSNAIGDVNGDGAVTRPSSAPFGGGSVGTKRFGEVAINLLGIFPNLFASCESFTNFWMKTRSSGESFNSELKDRTVPTHIQLSTCPNVSITKTADHASVSAGSGIGYTITVTNGGPGTAQNVAMTDTLSPADGSNGIDWSIAGTTNSPTCDINGGVLSCTKASMTSGTSYSVHVTSPTTSASCGSYTNTATVASDNEAASDAGDNSDSAEVVVNCPSIHITKTADQSTVSAGSSIGYVVNVWNSGPGTATGVHITDTLPANDGLSWTMESGPATCAPSNGAIDCTVASMAPGSATSNNVSIHLTSPTTAATCGTVHNVAHVSTTNDGSDEASADVAVNCPSIHITKIADTSTVSSGTAIGYSINVWNSGPGTATGVRITDTLPANEGLSWTMDSGPADCTPSSGAIDCTIASIAPGSSSSNNVRIHLTSPTTAATCGVVHNVAHVATSNDGSDEASADITVNCPSIHITKIADAPEVNAGDQVGFTVNVWNSGPGTASAVHVTDDLPANAGLAWSMSPSVDGCTLSGSSLDCTVVSMDPGTATSNNFAVHLVSGTTRDTCGTVNNEAFVTTSNDGSDNASASVKVDCPLVDITKSSDHEVYHVGDTITYTLTVTNAGDVPLSLSGEGFGVTDTKCSSAPVFGGGDINVDGLLDLSESWIYTCTYTVTDSDGTHVDNTASVVAHDVLGGENGTVTADDSHTVAVIHPAIDIVKSASPVSGTPGTQVTYTYVVTNTGDTDLSGVTVSDDKCSPVTFAGGDTNGDGVMQATETWTFKCVQVLSASGSITNVGTAAGSDILGRKVTADDTATVSIVLGKKLTKTGVDLQDPFLTGLLMVLAGLALLWIPARREDQGNAL